MKNEQGRGGTFFAQNLKSIAFMVLLTMMGLSAIAQEKLAFTRFESLDDIKAKIEHNGYNFTVGETWVYKLSPEEKEKLMPLRKVPSPDKMIIVPNSNLSSKMSKQLPASFDWRSYNGHNYTSPVKNQGSVGSCYSFGATACAEVTYNFKNNLYDANAKNLSQMYIIWTLGSVSPYNQHFNTKGDAEGADYEYYELYALTKKGPPEGAVGFEGVCDEANFPYVASHTSPGQTVINNSKTFPRVTFKEWGRCYPANYQDTTNEIKTAITTYGAVDAAVLANDAFSAYKSGIYQDTYTTPTKQPYYYSTSNHAIALVGWNDADGCWILRNSWGADWGEQGYMRIKYFSAGVNFAAAYLVAESAGGQYSISGTITGDTQSGVLVTVTGAGSGSATSAQDGTYTVSGFADGNYTVTPIKSGYTFTPASQAVKIAGGNQTGINFAATQAPTYNISGKITLSVGDSSSNVFDSSSIASFPKEPSLRNTLPNANDEKQLESISLASKYSYYYQGKLVHLKPSEKLVALSNDGSKTAKFAKSCGLEAQEHKLSAYLKDANLSIYKKDKSVKTSDLLDYSVSSGTTVQPVFEQGGAIIIPNDEVIVGFKDDTTLDLAEEIFSFVWNELGFLSIRNHRINTFIISIENPADGRVYDVSRKLVTLFADQVSFAEPNHVVLPSYAFENEKIEIAEELQKIADPTKNMLEILEDNGESAKIVELENAGPTWTEIVKMDFETDTLPTGWQVGRGQKATVDAYWGRTKFRKHNGSYSIYCAQSGSQAVNPPGPAPAGMVSMLNSPSYNFSGYEEVYIELWFYAKNEYVQGYGFTAMPFVYVVDNNTQTYGQQALAVGYTTDCTTDPTTANGWRRCLYRVPPAFRSSATIISIQYISEGYGSNEGCYIDDIRIVAASDVDTETSLGNDTYSGRIYELKNVGQIAGLGNDNNDLNAPEAWALLQNQEVSSNIVVAVIDDGVELTHPDLNLVTGYNYDGTVGGGPADDNCNHGTACAGNVGAIRNNSKGVIGTAPNVKIMPIMHGGQTDRMAASIDLAVSKGANVLSNSWGWVGSPSTDIANAINSALTAGKTVLFAAGNGPDRSPWTYEVAFPGNLSDTTNVICIGASSPTDEHKAAASSDGIFGWGSSYDGYKAPDVVVPGPWSYTTDRLGTLGYNDGSEISNADYTATFGGTSSSTPKAAGIVALMLTANPNLTPAQVKSILRNTATDIESPGVDSKTGAGRINAQAAVQASGGGGSDPAIATSVSSLTNSCTTGSNASSQTFQIWNSGQGALNFTISDNADWLSSDPTSGSSTGSSNKATITVTYSTSALASGIYNATITITATGATNTPQVITVTLTVTGQGGGLAGVTVSDGTRTATSDNNGDFTITGVPNGTYTVTPTKSGYSFTPATRSVTVSGANITGCNFTATQSQPGNYSISGTISGDVQQGVILALSGASSATTTSGTGGTYTFANLANGNYIVRPSLNGYTFNPTSISVTIQDGNETEIDFTASAVVPGTYSISGTISGDVQQGVILELTGSATATATSGADGSYSFNGLSNGNYTVTPSLAGYTFQPTSLPVTIANDDQTDVDFTATASDVTGSITKLSFTASYKDSLKCGVPCYTNKFTIQTTIQFGNDFDLDSINRDTEFAFVFGDYSFDCQLNEDPKAKFNGPKGGSATIKNTQSSKVIEKVTIKWDKKKMLTVRVTGTPLQDTDVNILDLSAENDTPPDIIGAIDNYDLIFNNATASFATGKSISYTGKKKTKTVIKDGQQYDLITWSAKGKL